MKAQVKTIEGGVAKDIELPAMFSEEYRPDLIKKAVKGMLPKNKLARHMLKKLKIYAGEAHPHAAQQPKNLNI